MSRNIRISDPSSKQHYIHLAAAGAPTFNVPVQFSDEASEVFSAYRDGYEFGASARKERCGNIYDSQNCLVGRISYNGRIYNGRIWDANEKPVEWPESIPRPDAPASLRSVLTP